MYTENISKYIHKSFYKKKIAAIYTAETLKMRHFQVAKYDDSFVLSCSITLDLH